MPIADEDDVLVRVARDLARQERARRARASAGFAQLVAVQSAPAGDQPGSPEITLKRALPEPRGAAPPAVPASLRPLRTGVRYSLTHFREHLLRWRDPTSGEGLSEHSISNRIARVRRWILELPSASVADFEEYAGRTPDFRMSEWNQFVEFARQGGVDVPAIGDREVRT
jgi:hypothetical protein